MTLPEVLAGPIVRRVDENGVSIWIALSEPADVEVVAWLGGGRTSTGPKTVESSDSPIATGTGATRAFGDKLHVAVVTAAFAGGAPPTTIFSYDVVVGAKGLKALELLEDEKTPGQPPTPPPPRPLRLALGYAKDVLPTFVTPAATLDELRFAQASCRNPKRPGPDALPFFDPIIGKNRQNPVGRPQQLFLTGDQVYVDDVAGVHLAMLSDIGVELMGDEEMPFATAAGATSPEFFVVNRHTVPPHRRDLPVRKIGRFSNSAGHSHLLTRGEFAAMYLSAWSPSVWRELLPDNDITAPPVPAEQGDDRRSLTPKDATWPEPKDIRELDRLRAYIMRFRDEVPKVARVLANVATYMIVDDHEVADDWNLTAAWTARVRHADLGRSIVRHGLGAFCIFQAWGNDPLFFESGAGVKPDGGRERKILDLLEADATAVSDKRGDRAPDDLDDAFGMTPTLDAPSPQIRFDFKVESLAHVVVGLDTRTRRSPSRGRESPPNLLGSSINEQIPEGPLSDDRALVLLIAEPLLKPVAFETFLKPVAANAFDLTEYRLYTGDMGAPDRPHRGFEKYEIESWAAVEEHFEVVLRRISTHPLAIVLSGEVHFAVDLVLDYYPGGDQPGPASRMVQLTSSAAKNPSGAMEQLVIRSHRWARQALRAHPFERLGWQGPSSIQLPAGESIPPARRARMMRSPALLPAENWPKGSSIPIDEPADWSWRLHVVRDERPDPPRTEPKQPPLPVFDPDNPLESVALIAARHAELARAQNDPVRSIVFASNVSVVRFGRNVDDELVVIHEISSPDHPDANTGSVYTQHDIGLTPAAVRPDLQFVP